MPDRLHVAMFPLSVQKACTQAQRTIGISFTHRRGLFGMILHTTGRWMREQGPRTRTGVAADLDATVSWQPSW